jgi:prevent-host-death family protein
LILPERIAERFPEDFAFRLTPEEKMELVAKCDRFSRLKHSPAHPRTSCDVGLIILPGRRNVSIVQLAQRRRGATMPRMTMTAARREISEAVNRMVYGKGEPIVLTRRGKDLAAIVPMADLKLMEEIENQVLLREIQARKKTAKGKGIPLAKLLKKYEE